MQHLRLFFTLLLTLTAAGAAPALAQSPEEQLAAASALFDAKRYAEAAQKLDAFLAVHARHAKAGAAALALGRCRSELRDYPKALAAYEKAVASKDPAVLTAARLGLGEAAIRTGQHAKAAAALGEAVKGKLDPEQAPVAWYWLGQSRLELKQYGPAEEAYLRVTRDYPKAEFADGAYFGAGVAALRQGKADAARGHFRAVVDRFPKSADRPQARLLLAEIDFDAKRYREARSGYEALLNDPAAKGAGLERAAEDGLIGTLLELQDYPAAATRLEASLARLPAADPQRPKAHLALGHCRYRQKQYAPALAAYREASKSPDAAVAGAGLYWAGNAALALEKPAEAAPLFTQLVTRYPKHELAAKSQLKAGDALLSAKQADAAAQAYRAVIAAYPQSDEAGEARKALGELTASILDPAQLALALKDAPPAERARGTLRLARLHLQGKNYAEAGAALAELLKAKPEPAVAGEASYLLGLAHEAQSKAAPAAQALAAALGAAPGAEWAADAHGRLAWLYLELKQPANAEKSAAAALALKLDDEAATQARLAQLQAQLDQQKWEAALEGCRALLEGKPSAETVATVLYTQAWIYGKQDRAAEALPLWERLAAEHPRSPHGAEALLRLGDASLQAEKLEEARTRYAALLSAHPQSPLAPEARFKLGSALYNLERYPEAAAEWERVIKEKSAGPYLPEALYWAGAAYEKAGKKEPAIQRLTRLITEFPKHERAANARLRLAALKAVK
ncbi:MAG: tetratricopeptide repeat protein [Armatimonadota bacterium]